MKTKKDIQREIDHLNSLLEDWDEEPMENIPQEELEVIEEELNTAFVSQDLEIEMTAVKLEFNLHLDLHEDGEPILTAFLQNLEGVEDQFKATDTVKQIMAEFKDRVSKVKDKSDQLADKYEVDRQKLWNRFMSYI